MHDENKSDTNHGNRNGYTHPPLFDCQSCIALISGEFKVLAGGFFSSLLVALLSYSLFIIGNDPARNVFKYPAIKTMLGADDDPNQVRTSCTITSCWSILERNVQAWYIEYPVYDMRQIDKNSYTASSCNSLLANYGPGLPAEANRRSSNTDRDVSKNWSDGGSTPRNLNRSWSRGCIRT